MGQENEQQAELIATIQHDHSAMKKWYSSHGDAKILHNLYGSVYPAFWKDVVDWKGWKETRKRYLKSIDGHLDSRRTSAGATSTSAITSKSSDSASKSTAAVESNSVPRKRKSRWATNTNTNTTSSPDPPKRKSRWARGRDPTPAPQPTHSVLDLLPGLPSNLSSSQSQHLQNLQKTLRECNAKLANLESEATKIDALPIGHKDRSPSPPPIYGPDGKRRNTRAVRWRERFTGLRQDTLESILKLTTGGNGSAASVAPSLFNRKRTRKIYIPVEDHPTYNFIGLIIGPRGKTQKEMENKTGCKIAIRGKGSVKEGARGRRDGKVMEGDNERLHVVVTGDNQANVDTAATMIEDMLVVIDDDKNIHKQAQLRELALLNGTLKEDEYCSLCAEKGHRAFECPKRFSMNKPGVEVKCAICGDTSHPTRDCKQKDSATVGKDTQQLDSDYLAFMNELDGKPADAKSTEMAGPSIQSLVTSIGPDGKPIGGAPMCQPIVTTIIETKTDILPVVKPGSGGSLITTISSRVVKSADININHININPNHAVTSFPTGAVTSISAATPAAGIAMNTPSTSSATPGVTVFPPSTTITGTVPTSPGLALPPPPSFGAGVTGGVPGNTSLPPPPPPPHLQQQQQQQQQMHQQYQQQQPYQQQHQQYGYGGYQQGGAQGYQAQGYRGQGQGYNNQQQYGTYGQSNNNGAGAGPGAGGWDYRSFYGNGNNNNGQGSGGSGGGGGNWWDSTADS